MDGLFCNVAREDSMISSCGGGVIVEGLQEPTLLLLSSPLLFAE